MSICMQYKKFILFAVIFFPLILNAQECRITLTGIVLDGSDGNPLEFTVVKEKNNLFKTTTDKEGKFSILGICAGTYILHFEHLVCEHLDIELRITQDTFVTVTLPHSQHNLSTVFISGNRNLQLSPVSKLSPAQLQTQQGNSIGDIMGGLSGVNILNTGGTISKPMINGMYGYRILIINNGIRQEGQNWGQEHAPEIDPFLTKDIELIRGASTLQYGHDAIGGVITVNPSSIFNYRQNIISGSVNTGLETNGRGGYLSTNVGGRFFSKVPLYWRLQGSLKNQGNLQTPKYFIDNTGYSEQNMSASIGTHIGRLTTDLFYSRFNNNFGVYSGAEMEDSASYQDVINGRVQPIDNGFTYKITQPRQESIHDMLKARIFFKIREHEYLKFIWAAQYNQRKEFDEHSLNPNEPETEYQILTHSGDLLWEKENKRNINHRLGLNVIYQQNHYGGEYFIPDYLNQGVGAFYCIEKEWNNLSLSGSARFDYKDLAAQYMIADDSFTSVQRNFFHSAFALSSIYQPIKNLNISLNLLQNWRPPAPNELYSKGMHHGLASYEEGNPNLNSEISHKAECEITWVVSNKWQAVTNFFVQDISGYITLIPDHEPKITPHGNLLSFHYEQTRAVFKGLNLQFYWKPTPFFSIEQKSSMLWATDITQHTFLPLIPPFQFTIEPEYTYKKLKFKLNGKYVAHQFRFDPASDIIPAPDAYFLLGAEITGKYRFEKQELSYFVRGSNLTNRSYRDYLDRFRYFIDKPGWSLGIGLGYLF